MDRFWSKVRKTDRCWLWTAAASPLGYGVFRVDGRNVFAHRVAWELTIGRVPKGQEVCHRCDNPRCVRPAHLFVGTHRENMLDASHKGRMPRGERQGASKLKAADVHSIRRRCAAGATQQSLARLFGVSQGHIGRIVTFQEWAHIGAPLQRRRRAKLTPDQVQAIRTRRRRGDSLATLAVAFGVDKKHVWRIAVGQSWPA